MIPTVFIHLKTGNEYLVLHRGVVNATNAQDGEQMVLYTPYTKNPGHNPWYVREETEFDTKFKEKDNG